MIVDGRIKGVCGMWCVRSCLDDLLGCWWMGSVVWVFVLCDWSCAFVCLFEYSCWVFLIYSFLQSLMWPPS